MLKIDFQKLRSESLKGIIQALEAALELIEIDYYLIGALARDAWFQQQSVTSRRTSDIDFAVLVPQREKFEELKTFLSQEKGFVETKGNSFAMLSPEGITVDILPFGSIEIDEDINAANGEAQVVTNGFKEIYKSALASFATEDGIRVNIASLPGIILLKLIAYQDRPEIRIKDPADIMEIIRYYFDLHSNYIYEDHADLFEAEQALEQISAQVIGRDIGNIVAENNALCERVTRFLRHQIEYADSSLFIGIMLRSSERYSQEDISLMLQNLLNGIEESSDGGSQT